MERRYDIARDEYLIENEDGKHKLIYAYFGLAIYHAQCLEETFSIMLWTNRIFKDKPINNVEVNEIIDAIENSKKTMGGFIRDVKQEYNLSAEIIESLYKVLEKRNYLAHKYFKLHIEKFYSELGHHEMLEYFCDFMDEAKRLDDELGLQYKVYIERLGMTKERINHLINEMKEKELKRGSSSV